MGAQHRRVLKRSLLLCVPALVACQDDRLVGPTNPLSPDADGPRLALSTAGAAPYQYRCARSIVPDQVAANERLRADYEKWRARRIWSNGAGIAPGGLRVTVGPSYTYNGESKPYATLSEGQGYGMLLAVYMGDKKTFDGLWAYAKAYLNSNGVMPWVIDQYGNVLDKNAATDGDQDIAFALLVADKKWGGYWNDLTKLLNAIKTHQVEQGTYVLKPGDVWGGSHNTFPGYFDPAWYKAFARYVGDSFWDNVAETAYTVMANVDAKGVNGATGFVPDESTASGDPVVGSEKDYVFTYDAIRAPWRLAKDAAWNCDARAESRLDRMNDFLAPDGPRGILSGYKLNGDTIYNVSYPNETAFYGPFTAAALASSSTSWRTGLWDRTVELGTELTWNGQQQDTTYYGGALRLLGMLTASGNMEDPLAGQRRRSVDDFESGKLSKWWTYKDASSTLTTRVISPAAIGYGMEIEYSLASWAGVGADVYQDWSGYRSFEFWVRGSGTGNELGVEIEDADGEMFRHVFYDDFTGWRFASVPLNTTGFPRRTDWQPVAVDNGLTLTNVQTVRFVPLSGQGTIAVDRIELIPG